MNTFNSFETGRLLTENTTKDFNDIPWSIHPIFTGVYLKHLITSNDTDGAFSYHLVKIEPNMEIGTHIHQTQLETHEVISGDGTCINNACEIEYKIGTISILPASIKHSVKAGKDGLYLFAKFFPALC